MPKLRILVTGGAGQVGSEFLRMQNTTAHDIHVCTRSELDMRDQAQIWRKVQEVAPDAVINCAAYTAVDNAEDEAEQAYRLNQTTAINLANVCSAKQICLVHYSTDYVFDGTASEPYREEDTPNPQGVYGASKLAGEESIRQRLDRHLILRVSWVFGRIGRSFVDTMLRLAKDRDELRVVDDQVGCPNSASWIAQTTLVMLEQALQANSRFGTYHLSSEPVVSWHQFAQEIFSAAEELGLVAKAPNVLPIPSSEFPTKAKRPEFSVLANTKAKRTFELASNNWRDDLKAYLTQAKLSQDKSS